MNIGTFFFFNFYILLHLILHFKYWEGTGLEVHKLDNIQQTEIEHLPFIKRKRNNTKIYINGSLGFIISVLSASFHIYHRVGSLVSSTYLELYYLSTEFTSQNLYLKDTL